MKHLPLILASKSPARLATLRAAGIEPEVRVSHVDEPAVLSQVRGGPGQQVLALATAKARAVLDSEDFLPTTETPPSSSVAIPCSNSMGGSLASHIPLR